MALRTASLGTTQSLLQFAVTPTAGLWLRRLRMRRRRGEQGSKGFHRYSDLAYTEG